MCLMIVALGRVEADLRRELSAKATMSAVVPEKPAQSLYVAQTDNSRPLGTEWVQDTDSPVMWALQPATGRVQ